MKPTSFILRTVLAWIALVAAQMVAGTVIPVSVPGMQNPASILPWLLVANLLTAIVVSYVGLRADLRRWKLGVALAAVPCIIVVANVIEGTVFLKNSWIAWSRILAMSVLTYILAAVAWALLFGRRPASEAGQNPLAGKSLVELAWRFVVSDISYLVLYMTAGTIIFPYVRSFYATQTLPTYPQLFALQLLIRGPMFVGCCLLLGRLIGLPRVTGALMTGLCFTILSGVVPLLVPNSIFPDAVRWVHMAEVTSSNFVFGFLVAWLWTPRPQLAVLLRQAA